MRRQVVSPPQSRRAARGIEAVRGLGEAGRAEDRHEEERGGDPLHKGRGQGERGRVQGDSGRNPPGHDGVGAVRHRDPGDDGRRRGVDGISSVVLLMAELVESLDNPKSDKDKIFYRNAEKILGVRI